MDVSNDAQAANEQNGAAGSGSAYKLKFCTVCASNQNRFVALMLP